jgi:hypothetical protein
LVPQFTFFILPVGGLSFGFVFVHSCVLHWEVCRYVAAAIYDPMLLGEGGAASRIMSAFCLFAYQTLDAMDGKQAGEIPIFLGKSTQTKCQRFLALGKTDQFVFRERGVCLREGKGRQLS